MPPNCYVFLREEKTSKKFTLKLKMLCQSIYPSQLGVGTVQYRYVQVVATICKTSSWSDE